MGENRIIHSNRDYYHQRNAYFLNRILCVLFLFPFLEPEGLSQFWLEGDGWNYWIVINSTVILIFSFFMIRRITRAFLLYSFFFATIFISTILNGGEIYAGVYYILKVPAFVALVEYNARQKSLHFFLSAIKYILGIYIILTLLFQIFAQGYFTPIGRGNYMNVLANDNFLGYWYIGFMVAVFFSNEQKPKWKQVTQFVLWGIICFISLVRAWSAACLAAFTVFLILMFFCRIKVIEWLTPLRSMLINIGLLAAVMLLQVGNLFQWFIEGILHKSGSFLVRLYIWTATIPNILEHPILGHGTGRTGRMYINYTAQVGIRYFSHNVFLEILITSRNLSE